MPLSPEKRRWLYAEYKRLLAETGEAPQWKRWDLHRRELVRSHQAALQVRRGLSPSDHRAFWLERFTWDEIRVIGAAIAPLLRDVEDPHGFLDARVARTEVAA